MLEYCDLKKEKVPGVSRDFGIMLRLDIIIRVSHLGSGTRLGFNG